jgi:hypothetical protein
LTLFFTTRSTLYKIFKPFMNNFIKKRIQTGIADAASAFIEGSFKNIVTKSRRTKTATIEVGKNTEPAPEYASKAFDVKAATAQGA